jgi:iron-sulfur cluster assembly protein
METATLAPATLPVSFTARAIEAIKRIQTEEQVGGDQALRVGVKGGGCSGMSYVLGFDAVGSHDDLFDVEGVRVALDKRHVLYLSDMEVDFQDGLNARGFTFANPNAKTTCGCGTSFSA